MNHEFSLLRKQHTMYRQILLLKWYCSLGWPYLYANQNPHPHKPSVSFDVPRELQTCHVKIPPTITGCGGTENFKLDKPISSVMCSTSEFIDSRERLSSSIGRKRLKLEISSARKARGRNATIFFSDRHVALCWKTVYHESLDCVVYKYCSNHN